jgi:Coenzyme PQQ synthesis protein D (PqqD)
MSMASIVSERSTVVAAEDQVSCNLASEAVVLDLRAGVYYGLNTVGARIWNLIQEPKTVRQICEAIVEEFDVAPDRCQRDLVVILSDLATRGLIKVEDAAAA